MRCNKANLVHECHSISFNSCTVTANGHLKIIDITFYGHLNLESRLHFSQDKDRNGSVVSVFCGFALRL